MRPRLRPLRSENDGQPLRQALQHLVAGTARTDDDGRPQLDAVGPRSQDLTHLDARPQVLAHQAGVALRLQCPEVDDPALGTGRAGEDLRIATVALAEVLARGALHRVDQVVRGVTALQRVSQLPGVTDVDLDRLTRSVVRVRVSRRREHLVSIVEQNGGERRADEAPGASQKDAHGPPVPFSNPSQSWRPRP